ncbi:MAG: hypothetical protein NZ908_01290 [Candidatus Micrarchaeota archaeon]|nr:hypothetical protein [Candidatus Micrarchaeota archaeon]MCX8154369.1 hypothetical protein [Candidatus Micrarchaeota archaeon]
MEYLRVPSGYIYLDPVRIKDLDDVADILTKVLGLGKTRVIKGIMRKLIEAKLSKTSVTIPQLYIELRTNKKTIYYHINRLRRLGLVSRNKGEYFLGESPEQPIREFLERLYLTKINEMFQNVDELFLIASNRF